MKAFLWSDEYEYVYGRHDEFESKEEFAAAAIREYEELTGEKCELADVKLQPCLHSDVAIAADVLVPMNSRNVSIMNWYTARVEMLN